MNLKALTTSMTGWVAGWVVWKFENNAKHNSNVKVDCEVEV